MQPGAVRFRSQVKRACSRLPGSSVIIKRFCIHLAVRGGEDAIVPAGDQKLHGIGADVDFAGAFALIRHFQDQRGILPAPVGRSIGCGTHDHVRVLTA